MTATTIRVQMAQRKDTAAGWTAANPILLSGEIGYETDTKKFKIGNGSTNWNSLAYLPIPDGSGNLTITGNLEIGSTGSLTFEGSTADGFETTLAVTNPTADRTITLPNQSGTVLVSGNASIVDADIAANAEIAVSKLADGAARQLLQTDAAGTGVEWTSNIDVPGTLDVTNTATFDSIAQYPAGSAAAPTITFTGDTNTGLFSPGSDQLALATGGTGRLFVDAAGDVGLGVVPTGGERLTVNGNIGVGGNLIARGPVEVMNSNYVYLYNTGSSTYWDLRNNSNNLTFRYNGSEAMRLDSSGRLGLGTSSAQKTLHVLNSGSTYQAEVRLGGTSTYYFDLTHDAATTGKTIYNAYALTGTSHGHQFQVSGTNALLIDSQGRVGIGTTAPTQLLHLAANNCNLYLQPVSNAEARIQAEGGTGGVGTAITFHNYNGVANGERARIDSSGRLLVGTSSSRSNAFGASTFQLEDAGGLFSVTQNANNAFGGAFVLAKTRGSSFQTVTSGDNLGILSWQGANGSALIEGARIQADVDGVVSGGGAGDLPTRLVFSTTADGASSPTERMRLDSSGRLGLGTSSPGYAFDCVAGTAAVVAARFRGNSSANNNTQIRFYGANAATDQWAIGNAIATDDATRNFDIFDVVSSANRLRIDSSGRVGIGTSNPTRNLDIVSSDTWIRTARTSGNAWLIGPGVQDAFRIYDDTAGVERFRIEATTGNVGIGTTSPGTLLALNDPGTGLGFTNAASGSLNIGLLGGTSSVEAYIYQRANGPLIFGTNNTERARIDSSGRLLVGTSTARSNVQFGGGNTTPTVQVETAGDSRFGLSVINNSANGYAGAIRIGAARGTSVGSNTALVDTAGLGSLSFVGADGTNLIEGARIDAVVNGTPGTNDLPTALVFSTTADGESSPTERMRITNNGDTSLFGILSVLRLHSEAAAGTAQVLLQGRYGATSGTPASGTSSIVVYTNGNVENTNNSYGAISDAKLKENIVDANSQWNDLKALQVRNYNFKEGQTHTQIGLVAQEVELVSPGLVTESPDRDEDGNDLGTVTKSVNYSVLYMKAVKALQEAMERIETLEAKVAALEGV